MPSARCIELGCECIFCLHGLRQFGALQRLLGGERSDSALVGSALLQGRCAQRLEFRLRNLGGLHGLVQTGALCRHFSLQRNNARLVCIQCGPIFEV